MEHTQQLIEELITLEGKIFNSILQQDEEQLQSLIADNFIGIGFAGQHVGKDIYIKVHTNPADPFIKYDVTHESIEIQNELAYIRGIQDVKAAIHLKSYYIGVYKRLDDQWKLFYWQETGIVDDKIFFNLKG
jgi:hypothetical protein